MKNGQKTATAALLAMAIAIVGAALFLMTSIPAGAQAQGAAASAADPEVMRFLGTTGATRLQYLSEALNTLAHHPAPDRGTYLTLLPQTLEALDALIHFVGTQTPTQEEAP